MTRQLDVKPRHREQIERLLRGHLPGVEVWAYGSRVNGRSHEGSDLDLVLRSPGLVKIDPSQLAEFNEAVQESTIPFLIEARDWARLPDSFQREIEREYVVLVEKEERGGAGEWRETTLGKVIELKRGYDLPQHKRTPGPVPVVSSSGPTDYHSESKVQGPGVVTGRYGTLGQVFFVQNDFWPLNTALYVRDFKGNDPRFISYFLRGIDFSAYSDKAAVPGLNRNHLHQEIVRIPTDINEQRAIAHILGTLDDKIELNRRMNETLEEMARTLFKSWFIDFDPVHAKAALRNHPPNHSSLEGESAQAQATAPVRSGITPPLRGSRQAKGDSPQASRWGDHAAPHPPRRWAEIKRQYSPQTLQRAQALRQNQTSAEGLLWHYLSRKQLAGYRFRRQQPIGPYIADFACLSEKLLIELDGGQHAERTASDNRRDRFLQEKGYRVLRFWNHKVFENCFGVLESIYAALPHHPPLEGGSKDGSLSGRGSPPPPQPAPNGLASATPPPGGSDWTVERARAYLDGMDAGIAALFPDRFVDSELGEVPEGWGVKALPEAIDINPTRSLRKGEVAPYLDMANMPTKGHTPDTVIDRPFGSGTRFANGDTLVARITPCLENGKTAYVDFLEKDTVGWGSTEYIVMRPKPPLPDEFAYCLARSTGFREFAIQSMTGSSGRQRVPVSALSNYRLPLPGGGKVSEVFGEIVQPFFLLASRNAEKSRTLAALRDTLLPKLISGAVRVGDSKRFLESVS